MPRCNNRLILGLVTLAVLASFWGCEQADDISSGISLTQLRMVPERLPSTPYGMIYEMWVATDSDTISLGTFGWDNEAKKFLSPTGADRPDSNLFVFAGDAMDYDVMFVSLELTSDPAPASPGAIMLVDDITDPGVNPLQMIFPESDTLWQSVVRYNMQSTSDDSRGQDGYGLWFSSYSAEIDSVPDTLDLVVTIDSTVRAYLAIDTIVEGVDTTYDSIFLSRDLQDTLTPEDVFVLDQYEITNIRLDSILRDYSSDTLTLGSDSNYHYFMALEVDSAIDSTEPYYARTFTYTFTTAPRNVLLDIFSQDDYNLPDYSGYGWRYKGWIVSSSIDTTVVSTRLTPPAWNYKSAFENYIPGDKGAMVTTGTFNVVDSPDDANPFVIGPKVPPYPGEDFLNVPALQSAYGLTSALNLLPSATGNEGTVFISLEPTNYPTDTTNFPLFVMIAPMPSNVAQLTGDQLFTMTNWTQRFSGALKGFPAIDVSMSRF